MKLTKTLAGISVLILAIGTIHCDLLENDENFQTLDGDIDQIWGSINEDSVQIGRSHGFSRTVQEGTIATLNVTTRYSRIIDGLRLRSQNNTGGIGDLLDGGVGYDFATFKLAGHSNYLFFVVDAYENYTSSLESTSTTTPIPNIVIEEWGTINYASRVILPTYSFEEVGSTETIESNITVSSPRLIDGIRLTSIDDTIASGELIEGGIGFNFAIIKVITKGSRLKCWIENFENGTYTTTILSTTTISTTTTILSTTLPSTTPVPSTTPKPEEGEEEWGKTDDDTKLIEKRFQNYPQAGVMADKNETLEISGTILGMRLKSLNTTDGLWQLIGGGLNESFATFNFKGSAIGRAYDFNIEIFGNSANSIKMSIVLVILSFIALVSSIFR